MPAIILPAKIFHLNHKCPKMARLKNQIILDSNTEKAYSIQIDFLVQERARIRQSIIKNKERLEAYQREKTLNSQPEIINRDKSQKRTKPVAKTKTKVEIIKEILKEKGLTQNQQNEIFRRMKQGRIK